MFILGILRVNIPPKVLFPQKKPSYQSKVIYLCSEKLPAFSFWGASPPRPLDFLNRSSVPGPRWGNSPQTPSSGVNPLVSTVAGHPQFLAVDVQKASASGGLLPPDPLPELCHWTTLGSVLLPSSLSCIKWHESLCFSLRLCCSNDVFTFG